MKSFLKQHALLLGLALMFLFTWPIDLANSGILPFRVPLALALLLGYGFVFASLMMTGLTLGKEGVSALLKRYLVWRVEWKWYLVAFLLIPVIDLIAVFLNAALARAPLDFSSVLAYRIFGLSADLPLLILPFFLFDALTNGEEIGWRGYVLPRLQAKTSALVSSLILGLIWGLWHLPKFMGPGNSDIFGWFMLKILAEAVLYTWLYNNTNGSLLLVTIFHAAGNTSGMFLPIANTLSMSNVSGLILAIGLKILTAVVVTIVAGPAHLSRSGRQQVTPAPAGAQ